MDAERLRTKAGASLIAAYPSVVSEAASPAFIRHQARAIRAIEDEMLDKVAAAVGRLYVSRHVLGRKEGVRWARYTDLLAAIEDIRKEASDGR